MRPVIVDSTQCHLWTDTLHSRQLAREARNKWDRGTYVRACVSTVWAALETSCQEALESSDIGYRFKENLDTALEEQRLGPIDWSSGLWQRVRLLQERRKSYVHRFLALQDMFPDAVIADEAVIVVRGAIVDIYTRALKSVPGWIHIDSSRGWDLAPTSSAGTISQANLGSSFNDSNTTRVYIVIDGKEQLTSVFPAGHDVSETVAELVRNVKVPIQGVRVYDSGQQVQDLVVAMRGG